MFTEIVQVAPVYSVVISGEHCQGCRTLGIELIGSLYISGEYAADIIDMIHHCIRFDYEDIGIITAGFGRCDYVQYPVFTGILPLALERLGGIRTG